MRYAFGQEIVKCMKKDKKIYLLLCDIGFGVFDTVKEKFTDRMINMGIEEQAKNVEGYLCQFHHKSFNLSLEFSNQ